MTPAARTALMAVNRTKNRIHPGGIAPRLATEILSETHSMIAGATGSGKSVLVHGVIFSALFRDPRDVQLVLIDPKRVELFQYRDLPHVMDYASEPEDIRAVIDRTVDLMEDRYHYMQANGLRKFDGSDVYVIIDEYADLVTVQKKQVVPALCRIAQLGRAAKIHLIIATQRPTRDIIGGQIAVNIDCRVALRCPTAQDSRNIIHQGGAERLPRYGKSYLLSPETMTPAIRDVELVPDETINAMVSWWVSATKWHPDLVGCAEAQEIINKWRAVAA